MNPKGYEEVYLDYRSRPITVTPQAYEQIQAIIRASMICKFCVQGYREANPMVAENVCLGCFLKHRDAPPRDLTFVGEASSDFDREHGYKRYQFLDSKGYVYLRYNTDGLNDTWERHIRATVTHYGFSVPTTYQLKGGTVVELETNAWRSIYGDFRTSPVLLVTYKEYYGNHLATAFLLSRDGTSVEFTRRKKQHRTWYDEAKAELEATYQPYQGYIVSTGADGEDRTSYQLEDHHLYPGIVARASQEYDQHKEEASTLF